MRGERNDGLRLLSLERTRQREKGYDEAHDDAHDDGSLVRFAIRLLEQYVDGCPPEPDWVEPAAEHALDKWMRDENRADEQIMTIAASLVVAEVERQQRARE